MLTSKRSTLLLSIGSTLYFAASVQNRSCSSLSFAGSLAARLFASAEVLADVVELPLVVVHVDRLAPTLTHGAIGGVVAATQPSW